MKRFKNLINQKLDKEIYKLARHEVQLILYKKKHFLRKDSMILLANLENFGRL